MIKAIYRRFTLGLQFQRVGVQDDRVKTAGGRHEQQLKAAHLEPEQETEGDNSKWHESLKP